MAEIKVTRTYYSKTLTHVKIGQLRLLASRLGHLRNELWQTFGGIPKHHNHRQIRDNWLKEKRVFNVPARLWKETLRDVIGDINACYASGFVKVSQALYRKYGKEQAQPLCKRLATGNYLDHPVMHRLVRKYLPRGHTQVSNQIVLDSDCYTSFIERGVSYLKVMGLVKGQRIVIPLTNNQVITGTIRLIINPTGNKVTVHTTQTLQPKEHGTEPMVGIDKGYKEVFTDSDGKVYGDTLGELLSRESDYLNVKYQHRNRLTKLAEKYDVSNPKKAKRIRDNNLGRIKLNNRKKRHQAKVKTLVYTSAHDIAKTKSAIVVEDLTKPINKKTLYKNVNRRLNGWVKGMIDTALEKVCSQYGVLCHHVNAAYTSQGDSRYDNILLGERKGDYFYCFDGVVLDADMNAAKNILNRHKDNSIVLWHNHHKVKATLLERTTVFRQSLESAQAVL